MLSKDKNDNLPRQEQLKKEVWLSWVLFCNEQELGGPTKESRTMLQTSVLSLSHQIQRQERLPLRNKNLGVGKHSQVKIFLHL